MAECHKSCWVQTDVIFKILFTAENQKVFCSGKKNKKTEAPRDANPEFSPPFATSRHQELQSYFNVSFQALWQSVTLNRDEIDIRISIPRRIFFDILPNRSFICGLREREGHLQ